jgi:hypothetical protein
MSAFSTLLSIVLDVLARAIKEEEKNKEYSNWKRGSQTVTFDR